MLLGATALTVALKTFTERYIYQGAASIVAGGLIQAEMELSDRLPIRFILAMYQSKIIVSQPMNMIAGYYFLEKELRRIQIALTVQHQTIAQTMIGIIVPSALGRLISRVGLLPFLLFGLDG